MTKPIFQSAKFFFKTVLVELTGIEPVTSTLQMWRSIQLSYSPFTRLRREIPISN
jgi:hypothetical protein